MQTLPLLGVQCSSWHDLNDFCNGDESFDPTAIASLI
jgi:hypothetical protein